MHQDPKTGDKVVMTEIFLTNKVIITNHIAFSRYNCRIHTARPLYIISEICITTKYKVK